MCVWTRLSKGNRVGCLIEYVEGALPQHSRFLSPCSPVRSLLFFFSAFCTNRVLLISIDASNIHMLSFKTSHLHNTRIYTHLHNTFIQESWIINIIETKYIYLQSFFSVNLTPKKIYFIANRNKTYKSLSERRRLMLSRFGIYTGWDVEGLRPGLARDKGLSLSSHHPRFHLLHPTKQFW